MPPTTPKQLVVSKYIMINFIRYQEMELSILCTHSLSPCCYPSYFHKGQKENSANYRPTDTISVPGKGMEQVMLEIISVHMKDKEEMSSS